MSGHRRAQQDNAVPSYVARMLGVEEEGDTRGGGAASDFPAFVEAVDRPTPYPSTVVRQTSAQWFRGGGGGGGGVGGGASHVHRILRQRRGEPEDVTRMRERLAAMGNSRPPVRVPPDFRTAAPAPAPTRTQCRVGVCIFARLWGVSVRARLRIRCV